MITPWFDRSNDRLSILRCDARRGPNILLYLASSEAAKADVAEKLISDGGHISVQVLNEFASVATRKLGMTWDEVADVLDVVREVCRIHPLTLETHDRARAVAQRNGFAFYDALIIAAALLAGCRILYSEDLQPGQKLDGQLVIRNPFLA